MAYARTSSSFDFLGPQGRSRAERIARLDALARLLDTAFVVPGTPIRFGIDAIIRLLPGLGDLATTGLALYVVSEARALGAPPWLLARMVLNVAIDSAIGIVPIVGDAIDVAWRVNRRNVNLLLDYLRCSESGYAYR